jgi:hypothetical protein
MRTESHNRLVAVLHLAHGFVAGVSAIGLLLAMVLLFGFKAALERWVFPIRDGGGSDPELWLGVFFVAALAVCTLFAVLFTVPAIAGGFGMLKQRRWARKLVIVSSVVAALDFPLGTALAVYTFWFLLANGRGLSGDGSGLSSNP